MKHILKGAAVLTGLIVITMIINIVCNMNGIELNQPVISIASSFCGVLIYNAWIRNEEKER